MSEAVDAVYLLREDFDDRALRCSLRSLDKFAPWIGKVHLVTAGEPPSWAEGRERLSVIRRADLFRERNLLDGGTLDDLAWRVFRIPGLSRRFLYLSDIFILGKPLVVDDFLNDKGGHLVWLNGGNIAAGSTAANAEQLLNSRFGNRSPRQLPGRTPRLMDSSFLEEVNRIWEGPIRRGGISLEALYSYYLLECPQQFGAHEKATGSAVAFDGKTGWRRAVGFLFARPRFFYIPAGPVNAAVRTILTLFYYKPSRFER